MGNGAKTNLRTTEGNSALHLPGRNAPSRVQVVYRGTDLKVPAAGWKLTSFSLRRDGLKTTTFKAHTYKQTVTLSSKDVPLPCVASTGSFASNRGSDAVTVMNGRAVSWPASATPSAPPAPFRVVFKFDKPFVLLPARNLCVEIVSESTTSSTGNYYWYADAEAFDRSSAKGSMRSLGRGCSFSFQIRGKALPIDGEAPLDSYAYTRVYSATPQPALLLTGSQASTWGGLKLPVDLTSIGAPGCKLYVAPAFGLAGLTIGGDARGLVKFSLGILPKQTVFQGIKLYQQAVVVDPLTNALGFRFSNYIEMTLGRLSDPLPARLAYHSSSLTTDVPSKSIDAGLVMSLTKQ